ncbi:transposase [Candidatus Margulisiibacteriota bacterium]
MKFQVTYKKRLRLRDFAYKGYYRYFVTICTINKKAILSDPVVIKQMIGFLRDLSKEHGFIVWAYCFMPDHLHLLLEGIDGNSDFLRFISMFKQKTGFWYKQRFALPLWQINYYEHVLRCEMDTKEVTRYIFENPVRRGIVECYLDYPFLGSFEFDINNIEKQP